MYVIEINIKRVLRLKKKHGLGASPHFQYLSQPVATVCWSIIPCITLICLRVTEVIFATLFFSSCVQHDHESRSLAALCIAASSSTAPVALEPSSRRASSARSLHLGTGNGCIGCASQPTSPLGLSGGNQELR